MKIEFDVSALANQIADLVVERLRGGAFGDMIDQHDSPLGPRRYIALVRRGASGCAKVGRRYLASRAAIEAELSKIGEKKNTPEKESPEELLRRIGIDV